MTQEEILVFADRFVAIVQRGDAEAMVACYAPGATIWHNTDDVEQTPADNARVLEWFVRTLPDRRYNVLRREALPDGFVQQHVLEATLPDGTPWRMFACVIVRMQDGLITRLDEYLDSAQGQALRSFGR